MFELAAQNILIRSALLALIFGLIVLAVIFLGNALARRFAIRSQLHNINDVLPTTSPAGGSLRSRENDSAWAKLAAAVEKAGLGLEDSKGEKRDRLADLLRKAGYTSSAAPRIFTLARLFLIFVLPLGFVLLSYMQKEPPSFFKLYLIGSILALLGLYLPNLYVQAKADRRQLAITNGFPDCLDLLLVCVESGLGIEAAMDRVGREMVKSEPLVAELLSAAVLQLRAGASREEAFRKMADKAAVDDIRSFATLLVQSDKLGTSISTTLRVYAAEMREKRRMRAEEKAHRLPVLLSIPLVSCMLPTMIGTLMLPAVIMFIRTVGPMMTGG